MDHKCVYCKDGWTWCFGPCPSEGSGLVALACQECIDKYETIEDAEERKKAILENAKMRANDALNELSSLFSVYHEHSDDEKTTEKLGKIVGYLAGWIELKEVTDGEKS